MSNEQPTEIEPVPMGNGQATPPEASIDQADAAPMVEVNTLGLFDEEYVDAVDAGDESQQKKAPPSKTAIIMDQWSLRRGREILDESDAMKQSVKNIAPNEKRQYKEALAADLFALAWEPAPELAPECEDQLRSNYFRSLMETQEYQELHAQTQFSDVASEIAAAQFAAGYAEVVKVVASTGGETIADQAKVLKVVKKVVDDAKDGVQQAQTMANALGVNLQATQHSRSAAVSSAEVGLLFSKLRNNRQLQDIMRLAGRYRRLAQSRQRTKPVHGMDEVCGVTQTGEIERLLPSELALLDIPELEDDMLRRLVERNCMGYDFQGRQGEARGPIVVVVDESGSMGGEPIAHAKAIALAMAWIARHQKRYCCLVSFSSGGGGVFMPMPGGECPPAQLLEWLEGFIGGGTDLVTLTEELPAKWESLGCTDGKTDIICITDASLYCEDDRAARFKQWKAEHRARLETIVVGCDAGEMTKISDRCRSIDRLGVEVEEVGDLMEV